MRLSLIVALDRNGLIGNQNGLPWRLPADLKHFKTITMNKPVIMGRKTCESIGRPLPGRRNLVITRSNMLQVNGYELFTSIDGVLAALNEEESVIIGGAEVYRLFWNKISRAYITLIDAEFKGDTWFPEWPLSAGWDLKTSDLREPDDKNPYPMNFMVFEKVEKN